MITTYLWICLVGVLIFGSAQVSHAQRGNADVSFDGQSVDAMIAAFMKEHRVPGMTLAIEPMVSAGALWRTRLADDGWTVSTTDGALSAHFEHTIAITHGAAEILTAL